MKDSECVGFLQWALPLLKMRWPGFRKVRRQVGKRIDRRMRELEIPDIKAYRDYLENNPQEWQHLDRFCRISISRFYRDRGVFEFLRTETLPMLAAAARARGERIIRCWNAGCASGEEPYTLNILWKLEFAERLPELDLSIIATDSDPHMLQRAEQGLYQRSSLKDLPADWLPVAFTQSGQKYCLRPEFRSGVEFLCQDIRHEMPEGQFQIICCRHLVFTYFEEELQGKILQRMLNKLDSGGVLITGKQESLPTPLLKLEPCHPHMGIYQKKG